MAERLAADGRTLCALKAQGGARANGGRERLLAKRALDGRAVGCAAAQEMTGLLKVRHPHHHVGGGRLGRRSVLPLGDGCKSCRSSSSSHGTDPIRNTIKGSVGQAEANAKFGFSGAMAANFTAATAAAYAAVAAAAAARKPEQATSNLPSC